MTKLSKAAGYAREVKQNQQGSYIIGGETDVGEASGQNISILKTNSMGNINAGCGYRRNSNAVVIDSHIVPIDTNELPWPTDGSSGYEGVTFEEGIHLTSYLLCWNLNQSPLNINFQRQENLIIY